MMWLLQQSWKQPLLPTASTEMPTVICDGHKELSPASTSCGHRIQSRNFLPAELNQVDGAAVPCCYPWTSSTQGGAGRRCRSALCIGAEQRCGHRGRMGGLKPSASPYLPVPMPTATTKVKTEEL